MINRKDKNGDEIIINKSREDKKNKITIILPCELISHGRIENKNWSGG